MKTEATTGASELPPLPEPAIVSTQTDSTLRVTTVHSFSHDQMDAYGASCAEAATRTASAGVPADSARLVELLSHSMVVSHGAVVAAFPSHLEALAWREELREIAGRLVASPTPPPSDRQALELAMEALDSIALAGMSGSGQESEEGMRDWHARRAWDFIAIAARAKTAIAALGREGA